METDVQSTALLIEADESELYIDSRVKYFQKAADIKRFFKQELIWKNSRVFHAVMRMNYPAFHLL